MFAAAKTVSGGLLLTVRVLYGNNLLCLPAPAPCAGADFNLEEKLQPNKGAGGASGGDGDEGDDGDSIDREAAAREDLDPEEWEEES